MKSKTQRANRSTRPGTSLTTKKVTPEFASTLMTKKQISFLKPSLPIKSYHSSEGSIDEGIHQESSNSNRPESGSSENISDQQEERVELVKLTTKTSFRQHFSTRPEPPPGSTLQAY